MKILQGCLTCLSVICTVRFLYAVPRNIKRASKIQRNLPFQGKVEFCDSGNRYLNLRHGTIFQKFRELHFWKSFLALFFVIPCLLFMVLSSYILPPYACPAFLQLLHFFFPWIFPLCLAFSFTAPEPCDFVLDICK